MIDEKKTVLEKEIDALTYDATGSAASSTTGSRSGSTAQLLLLHCIKVVDGFREREAARHLIAGCPAHAGKASCGSGSIVALEKACYTWSFLSSISYLGAALGLSSIDGSYTTYYQG